MTTEFRTIAIDALRLHPDADRIPMPDASDLRALRESLSEDGQQDPIDATEEGVILDGRTRWTLLRDLGATTVQVRVVYIPEGQQTHYIVRRAVARRHLTTHQKKDLNDLLRVAVIEERPTKRGNVMRIGLGQTQRAEDLGVERETIKRWDKEGGTNVPPSPAPTHYRTSDGKVQPLHPDRKPRGGEEIDDVKVRVVHKALERPTPLRKARPIPSWSRHYSNWLRSSSRPEDRDFLRRLDRELHAALDRTGITCEREKVS